MSFTQFLLALFDKSVLLLAAYLQSIAENTDGRPPILSSKFSFSISTTYGIDSQTANYYG